MKTVDIVKEAVPSDVLGASLIALAWMDKGDGTVCPVTAPPRGDEGVNGVGLVGDVLDKLWENEKYREAFKGNSMVSCQEEREWEKRGNSEGHYWYQRKGLNYQRRLEALKKIFEGYVPSAVLFYIPKPLAWLVPWNPESEEQKRYDDACKNPLLEGIYTITCPINAEKSGKLHEGADAYLVLGKTDEDRRIVAHGRVQRGGEGYCVKCLYCGKNAEQKIEKWEEIVDKQQWPPTDKAVEIKKEETRQELWERWTRVVGDMLGFNRIIFGAPGTGKSYLLNKQAENCFDARNMERVTFHPEYTYFDFVGSYKPVMEGEKIKYEFVPGPFARMLKQARKAGEERFCLIVEEINRARVAAVFGDTFQLLDRKEDGESVYEITPSLELARYLQDAPDLDDEHIERIRIPRNLYIWATMNSADQGVYSMDTAFKRRWRFMYLGIDAGKENVKGAMAETWRGLREHINLLLQKAEVNEDKQLGPFFLHGKELENDVNFMAAFKSKVLMYLYEDAARHKRKEIFKENGILYSQLCTAAGNAPDNLKDLFKEMPENA